MENGNGNGEKNLSDDEMINNQKKKVKNMRNGSDEIYTCMMCKKTYRKYPKYGICDKCGTHNLYAGGGSPS